MKQEKNLRSIEGKINERHVKIKETLIKDIKLSI